MSSHGYAYAAHVDAFGGGGANIGAHGGLDACLPALAGACVLAPTPGTRMLVGPSEMCSECWLDLADSGGVWDINRVINS